MAGKVPVAAMVGNGVNRVALTVRRTMDTAQGRLDIR